MHLLLLMLKSAMVKRHARLTKAFKYESEGPVITQLDPDSGPGRRRNTDQH